MSRFPRILLISTLALSLSLTALTPAGAVPRPSPQPAPEVTIDWVASAWSFLQALLTGAPTGPAGVTRDVASNPQADSNVQPLTGSCIDPLGRPVPCNH